MVAYSSLLDVSDKTVLSANPRLDTPLRVKAVAQSATARVGALTLRLKPRHVRFCRCGRLSVQIRWRLMNVCRSAQVDRWLSCAYA